MADKYPQESVVFKCNATGSPKPQITWFHNGQKVAPSNVGRIQINSKNELKFTSLQSGDKRTVQCVATNDGGEAISKATFNVKSKYQACCGSAIGSRRFRTEANLHPLLKSQPYRLNW